MPRSVLIPVDGSENSQRAFDFYVSDIRHADDVILLCHVQHPPSLSVVSFGQPLNMPIEEWTFQIKDELIKSQKVVTHYEMICEEKHLNKKVSIVKSWQLLEI